MKIATANVRDTLDLAAAEQALRLVLAADPDLVFLEEWGTSRDGMLERVCRELGYRWARAKEGGGPVVWRASLWHAAHVRATVIAKPGFMGHLPGRKDTLPPSYVTVVVLIDDYGHETTAVEFHLTANVQYGSGYRKGREFAMRVRRHKKERRGLARVGNSHKRAGRKVRMGGDSNFAGMTIPGFVSCWEGHPGGSLGGRPVDIVFSDERAAGVLTITTKSDHKAVVADYPKETP